MRKLCSIAIAAVSVLAGATSHAALLSGTWDFSVTTTTGTTYSGSFCFDGLDTTLVYTNSTGAGFCASTDWDTSSDGGKGFSWSPGGVFFAIGGLGKGVTNIEPNDGFDTDWALSITGFPTGTIRVDRILLEGQRGLGVTSSNVTLREVSVPEPGALALVGLGLAGVAWLRRRTPS